MVEYIYRFYWEDAEQDDEQQFVSIESSTLSEKQLKDKVIAILNNYRKTNPIEYNMPEFLAYLRKEGISVKELIADEEVYF